MEITHWAKPELPRVSGRRGHRGPKTADGLLRLTLQAGDRAETELVLWALGHPLLFLTYQAAYRLWVSKAAPCGLKAGKLRLGDSVLFSPGHHPRQPGPSFPRLHCVPGGLQSLHL